MPRKRRFKPGDRVRYIKKYRSIGSFWEEIVYIVACEEKGVVYYANNKGWDGVNILEPVPAPSKFEQSLRAYIDGELNV